MTDSSSPSHLHTDNDKGDDQSVQGLPSLLAMAAPTLALSVLGATVLGVFVLGVSAVLAIVFQPVLAPRPAQSIPQPNSPSNFLGIPDHDLSPSSSPWPNPQFTAEQFMVKKLAIRDLDTRATTMRERRTRPSLKLAGLTGLGGIHPIAEEEHPRLTAHFSGIFDHLNHPPHGGIGRFAQFSLSQASPSPAPDSMPESSTTAQQLKLKLADVVVLVLQNNRSVKNAYLQRILDRRDLELAESKFSPQFTPEIRIAYDRSYFDTVGEQGRATASVGGNLLLPTGARISVNLVGESFGDSLSANTLRQGFNATITQPLLREYGIDVNEASVKTARLQEQANGLSLKATIIAIITQAIRSYRDLLLAQEQLNIQLRSLAQLQSQLEETKIRVELGQRPRADIVQAEASVAQQEVAIAAARNSLGQTQLALLRVLNLEQTLVPVAIELPQVQQAVPLEAAPYLQTALANNPNYLQAILAIDQGKLQVLLAQNRSQWNLDLQASLGNTLRTNVTGQVDLGAAIVLSRTFGDLSLEQGVERSQIQLQQLENNRLEAQENLAVDVRNSVRAVNDSYQQLLLAREALRLAELQLTNEREKYRLQLGNTRQIDVLRFENDLARANNDRLSAEIAYLNALTQLDELTGTTLETWKVTLEAN